MPWLPEYKQEEEALYKEKVNLGLIKDTSTKKAQKANDKNKKKQSQLFQKKEKEEEKVQINLVTPEKSGNDEEKPKTEAQLYSKVVKVGRVENFDWKYNVKMFNETNGNQEDVEINIDKIEAIYINPKWKQSKVGDYLTYNKKQRLKKGENPLPQQETQGPVSSKFDSAKIDYDFKVKPLSTIQKEDDESSDDEQARKRARARAEAGLSIEEFKKLQIPNDIMKDGMIFIWVEKEYIYDIVKHLETQNFFYVENVCYIALNQEMEKGKFKFHFVILIRRLLLQRSELLQQLMLLQLLFKMILLTSKSPIEVCSCLDEHHQMANLSCVIKEPVMLSLTGKILATNITSQISICTD